MRMSTRLAALAAALTLSLGVASMSPATECHALKHLTWLLGSWRTEVEGRVISEHWAAVSTETWEGFGQTRAAAPPGEPGAAVDSESLRLVEMAGEVFYLAKVAHNPVPTAFRLSECGEGFAVFENPEHDFPRRLEYRIEGNGLTVRVSDGVDGGKGFTLRFNRG